MTELSTSTMSCVTVHQGFDAVPGWFLVKRELD